MPFDAAPAAPHPAVADLSATGAHRLPALVDPAACARLLAEIKATRSFDAGLFLSEAAFDADPQHKGVNPRPGRNLLATLDADFVTASPVVADTLTALLGDGYVCMDAKIVCGVPASEIPAWLRARIEGAPVNNLGPYVREAVRDVTYFYGIDYHQDLIDHPARAADFVTLYVYLHEVGAADAPLHVLEGSHRLGAAVFPHALERTGEDAYRYANPLTGGETDVSLARLTGPAGTAAVWHACTLHGTRPDAADEARLSLRYLFGRGPGETAGLDAVNATLEGPLSLEATRRDLDHAGAAAMRGNIVNQS